eukprot:TRINITY_DN27474_c0_g1_i3.p1 TRINITY_DN27474_c0_g1~~TRINITY_DN27474_c0_g1_i3.p1  ORF type:complete len:199 (+),score=53.57 TRINITY_DN27474_c0_g1_i3:145-741(+)
MSGFWQDGSVLEALANWMHRGNNTRELSIIRSSWRSLDDLLEAYQPMPSFDDMAWYGMAYARIYELLRNQLGKDADKFGGTASDIFKWIEKHGWDTAKNSSGWCGGGFWWDSNKDFKATITNVQMIYLGAKLHNLLPDKDPSYLQVANRTWNWVEARGIIDPATTLLANAVSLKTCNCSDSSTPWTCLLYTSPSPRDS